MLRLATGALEREGGRERETERVSERASERESENKRLRARSRERESMNSMVDGCTQLRSAASYPSTLTTITLVDMSRVENTNWFLGLERYACSRGLVCTLAYMRCVLARCAHVWFHVFCIERAEHLEMRRCTDACQLCVDHD